MDIPNYVLNIHLPLALEERKNSPLNKKMGAVIFNKRKVLASGSNNTSRCYFNKKQLPGCHAEISALMSLLNSNKKVDLLIVGGNLCSKPCFHCIQFIRRFPIYIRRVYFYEQGILTYENFNSLENERKSLFGLKIEQL